MLTVFGKALRKLRIDRSEVLKDMADKLGISSSYLSSIETGQRQIPKDFLGKVRKTYNLSILETEELTNAYEQSISEININLNSASDLQRNLAIAFARSFENLDEESIQKIQKSLETRRFKSRR